MLYIHEVSKRLMLCLSFFALGYQTHHF